MPQQLEYLEIGTMLDKSLIQGTLPANLKTLKFGQSFNQPLGPNVLPSDFKKLEFGESFNQPLNVLPDDLRTLIIGAGPNYTHELSVINLPVNLVPDMMNRWHFKMMDSELDPEIIDKKIAQLHDKMIKLFREAENYKKDKLY